MKDLKRIVIGLIGIGVIFSIRGLGLETLNTFIDFLAYSVLTLVIVDRIKGR